MFSLEIETLARLLIDEARQRSLRIVTAESCTGGLVAAAICAIPGASDVFERGFVVYTNRAKQEMLGIRAATLAAHGAVSEEIASEMALGALKNSQAALAVSVTGIAGPGGSEHKPEGRVCFGLATRTGVATETVEFGALGRDRVRAAATEHALALLLAALA